MNKELENKLYTKYSDLFVKHTESASKTCMCWGCTCGDGWYPIIDRMCSELSEIQERYGVSIIFDQIKEKFGTLRVYSHFILGPRWTQEDEIALLDGKPDIELVRFGWMHPGVMVSAYPGVRDRIDEIIQNAVHFSEITCEFCGMTGAIQRNGGWIHTLCDACHAKREQEMMAREAAIDGNVDDTNHESGEQAGSSEAKSS